MTESIAWHRLCGCQHCSMSRGQQLRDALWYQCLYLVVSTVRLVVITTICTVYPDQIHRAVLSIWLLGWLVLDVSFWPLRVRDVQHWRLLYRRRAELESHHIQWIRFKQSVRNYRCVAWGELWWSFVGLPFLVLRPSDRTTAPAAYWTTFALYAPLFAMLACATVCMITIMVCLICNTLAESCHNTVMAQLVLDDDDTDTRHTVIHELSDVKHGLSDEALSHLPCMRLPPTNPTKADPIKAEAECAICLTVLQTGDECRRLDCNHTYHRACLDPWLRRVAVCPMCKAVVVSPLLPDL